VIKLNDWPMWVILVVSVGLCVWGAIAGQPTPGGSLVAVRVVCIATAVVFVAIIGMVYVWRYIARRKIAYVTKDGLSIIVGAINAPTQTQVEAWTYYLLHSVWSNQPEGWTSAQLAKAIKGAWIEFSDDYKIVLSWQSGTGNWVTSFVHGYARGQYAKVGSPESWVNTNTAWTFIMRLFYHELFHVLLYRLDAKYYDQAVAHARMKAAGV